MIKKVFGPTQETVSFASLADAKDFLTIASADSWKIFITGDESIEASEFLNRQLRHLLATNSFHLVLCGNGKSFGSLDDLAARENLHVVNTEGTHAFEQLEHHLHGIKTSLNLSWAYAKTTEVLRVYEDVRARETGVEKALSEFIHTLKAIVGSSSISVFVLQIGSNEFRPIASTAQHKIKTIPNGALEEVFQNGLTLLLRPDELRRLNDGGERSNSVGFGSCFMLQTIPIFVLYVFECDIDTELLRGLCNTSSREIFHLLRSKQIGAQYKTLRAITEIGNLDAEKEEVLFRILFHLKTHFHSEGVAAVELRENDDGIFEFEKTYIERANKGNTTFPAEKGFANHAVFNNKALLITECFERAGEPFGRGYEFDPDRVGTSAGSPVEIPSIRADESFEDEKSLMYFPFRHGDAVGAIKISDFSKPKAFDLFQLCSLKVFAEPIASILGSIKSVAKLRSELHLRSVQDKMIAQAEVLFFYREIALGIFHQVGNHLASISSEMMLLDLAAESQGSSSSTLKTNINEANEQLRLARDLIRKAQKRGQHLTPISQKCELISDIVRPAIDYAKKRVGDSNIEIKHALTNEQYPLEIDVDLAKESMINILNNAISAVKANKSSKKEIFIGVRKIAEEGAVEIKIVDSGVGIDPVDYPKLFTPFFTTRTGGTGLGLYFTRKLVEHFGGTVVIQRSNPGKGTTVVFRIPVTENA